MIAARLTVEPIDPAAELRAFAAQAIGAGAIVTFTGIVRAHDEAGSAIRSLFLDHYPGMTEASMDGIARLAAAREGVDAVSVVHRCGLIPAGDTVVFVAAAGRHRRAAFLAADELMDRLKTEALFWKKESGERGAHWIEPTARDHDDAARWSGTCQD